MLYRFTEVAITPQHEAKYGKWGDPPPNFREVTAEEFDRWGMWRVYSPELREYRQFNVNGQHFGISLHYFHDGTGYGLHSSDGIRGPKFYIFGCAHTWEELSRPANHRSGIHRDRCTKCGYEHEYDTSD